MKQFIDIVNEGIRNDDTGHAYCYGEKYGTEECPLYSKYIFVYFKDGKEMNNPEDFKQEENK